MQQSGYGFVDKLNLVESLLWQGVWVTQWSVYWLLTDTRGGMAQWVARLTHDRWIPVSREFLAPSMAPVVSLSKKLYSYCLVLVGSRNRFERTL